MPAAKPQMLTPTVPAGSGRGGSYTLIVKDSADLKDTNGQIVTTLSVVRGIGQWTAEMFLIFQLRRLDVWPVGDYGVRKGYALAYGLPRLPTPKELLQLGERFRPYRTVAAWYCWRAVDQ